LADRYGAILAFDEIITGFRLALGGAQERYGVRPDLAALGKVAGGGLPLGVVCGLEEIVSMADPSRKGGYTSIGGGTFSENPLSMAAGLATVRYLRRNRERVYPRLEAAGRAVRTGVDRAFEEEGVVAHTTGMGSLFLTHFGPEPKDAEEASRADRGRARDYALDMMTRGVFLLPGHPGAVSTAHTMKDIGALVESARAHCRAAKARRREGR
jgi:glutamate-1-semialdehyde 2,1-aminomutase